MLPLAPEGRPYVAAAAVVVAGTHAVWGAEIAWPSWILLAVAFFIFRDFSRKVAPRALAVLSPVDGVVTEVAEHRDPYLGRPARRVSLRQSRFGEFNVHSPIEGKVQARWWPGKEGVKEGLPGDEFALQVQTDEGDEVVFAIQIRGLRLVRCGVQSGERMGQGRRCGFLGFGLPVQVYLPMNSRVEVAPGQRLKAGSDIIGILVHKESDKA
ncbi:phosphatidylserine decarboxylase [Thioalkalivibrio sulfidiphilus]|uniref:Phosphatidylserine decarboxylase n=1 Tax=Thioalkalivibrio sulfidiphilus (strain HL-EbGR7) TaxID=396588 RepID=B8GUB5_THISH|nr:phosphatidylserine decarboxylase [Thioalkalivibrio sulfidiphilus]ACL73235.1 phosphatidylserine decarboxylase [Thioalkalivibrio sulfidiphilus HL-EbGr7]